VLGMNLNVPPWLHPITALALRIAGMRRGFYWAKQSHTWSLESWEERLHQRCECHP
jgi:hypothetical protein